MDDSDYSNYFVQLYKNVLEKERKIFEVKDDSIKNAIRVMKDAYLPDPSWRSKSIPDLKGTNYDDPAFRCAYLHKYAMCYTGMVCHLLHLALDQSYEVYDNFDRMQHVNLCSLGGGPGTDVVGVLASMNINIDSWSATVVDLARNWRITFQTILFELQNGNYGPLRSMAKKLRPYANFLKVNLLENWGTEPLTEPSIRTADIVLMVKFISAAACKFYTERMTEKVFHCLKPGAMVLFIDNAAGGFDKMVKHKASDAGLASIYGPLFHYDYENSKFDMHRFGSKSQSKSRVFFEVYQKRRYTSRIQRGYVRHSSDIVAHAGIEYATTQGYEEMPSEEYVRNVKRFRQQTIDNDELRPCDVLMFFVLMLIIGAVIKFYKEV